MSNYVKATNFTAKDSLPSGNAGKIVKGAEIDTELTAVASAISSKADLNSPGLTGTPTTPTATAGTNTTQVASTAFVTTAVSNGAVTERSATATLTNKTIDLASNTLTGTTAQFNTALSDDGFATLSGSETLANKTLSSPALTGTPTSTTAAVNTNTTQVATTAFVQTQISTERTAIATLTNKTLTSPTINSPTITSATITSGTITGITDLAVADGGTGASTLAANAVLLGNGTSALQTVAPGASGNVLTSNGTTWQSTTPTAVKGLGLGGEVWNDLTGSRSFNSQYTNNRSYPIAVSARTTCSTSSAIAFIVDGVTISNFSWQFNGCGSFGGGFVIVPPGKTYQLNSGQGVDFWRELY